MPAYSSLQEACKQKKEKQSCEMLSTYSWLHGICRKIVQCTAIESEAAHTPCRKLEKKNGTATVSEPLPDPSSLPDEAILSMLQREVLLTEAKLHALDWELLQSDRNLRQFRSQLRQVTTFLHHEI